MNELALFAGAGGGILGGILSGFTTICAVEMEPYCREVLLRRQRDRMLPLFPIWDDAKTFDGRPWRGAVDIITAGFPCQPFSVAGSQRGQADERNLWPHTIRILREVGPRYALLENVPGLLTHDYFGQILGDLADAGFDAEWDIVSAAEVGAPHLRKRLWIVAHAKRSEWREDPQDATGGLKAPGFVGDGGPVANPCLTGLPQPQPEALQPARRRLEGRTTAQCSWWNVEPPLGRVVAGLPNRIHQLRCLGNAQVPRVALEAWERLNENPLP
jgi:DNA (cytosine-5)-methyltransferase 1